MLERKESQNFPGPRNFTKKGSAYQHITVSTQCKHGLSAFVVDGIQNNLYYKTLLPYIYLYVYLFLCQL